MTLPIPAFVLEDRNTQQLLACRAMLALRLLPLFAVSFDNGAVPSGHSGQGLGGRCSHGRGRGAESHMHQPETAGHAPLYPR